MATSNWSIGGRSCRSLSSSKTLGDPVRRLRCGSTNLFSMACVPSGMLPNLDFRRVLDMKRGEKALVGMHAFKVDSTNRTLFLNNTAQINDPERAERSVEVYLDEAGAYHVDWKHKSYAFIRTQIEDMKVWQEIGKTKNGCAMVPVISVVNWPE